jgi:aspartate/methionine/tyrosine aminotransferase
MLPFALEAFFDDYEHKPDFINLASSDARPWTAAELRALGVGLTDVAPNTLAYPDVPASLQTGLDDLLNPASGMAILPTSGAAEAIALVMHERADHFRSSGKGRMAIPAPTYGAFAGLTELLGIAAHSYSYDPGRIWAPDYDEMLEFSRQCDAVVVVTPHNPSGHVVPLDVLQSMAQHLADHDGVLIVDEVFRIPAQAQSAIELGHNVIAIGSLSKTYGLPGLRLGWVVADRARVKRMRTVQQYLTLTLSAMTAAVGAAILRDPEKLTRADLIQRNRRIVLQWADANPDLVSISPPAGGTTVCLTLHTTVATADLFASFLKHKVLLAPGARCFGCHDDLRWFRLGYGTASSDLQDGLDRIGATLR